jgi:hypothetical protein
LRIVLFIGGTQVVLKHDLVEHAAPMEYVEGRVQHVPLGDQRRIAPRQLLVARILDLAGDLGPTFRPDAFFDGVL